MKSKIFKSTWIFTKTGSTMVIQRERIGGTIKKNGLFVVYRHVDGNTRRVTDFKRLKDAIMFVQELQSY